MVKKRKRRCFGFISMFSGLAKRVMQGSVQGKIRGGRQKKRWEGSITEWTGITLDSTTRAAENKTTRKVICGVPTTLQPLGRPEKKFRLELLPGIWEDCTNTCYVIYKISKNNLLPVQIVCCALH